MKSRFIDIDSSLNMLRSTNQTLSAKLVETLNKPCYRMVGCDNINSTLNSYYILQYRSTLNNTKYCSQFKLHGSQDCKQQFVVNFPHGIF